MTLKPIAANQTELHPHNGMTVFFSYKTPVAAWVAGKGYLRTEKFWSVTTSRHINKWLPNGIVAKTAPQEFFDNLIAVVK